MNNAKNIRVLVACEESQAVTIRLRNLGITAFSCDTQDCSGGFPQWHIKGDMFSVIDDNWSALIAFPPCTHLAVSGAAWFEQKIKDGRQQLAIDFFMKVANAQIKHIAIENPVGIMSKKWRKPDQIIQPYYFGDEAQKTTCLWLKNLPKLIHNKTPNLFESDVTHVGSGELYFYTCKKTSKIKSMPKWYSDAFGLKSDERAKIRSKTFPGIADAMANQWGKYLIENK